jgi:hypothetical protein
MAEFTLFPNLPLELRRNVWRFAALTERIIEIRWNHHKQWYYSSTPSPSVLHASRESRIEALMCYELLEIEDGWDHTGGRIDQELESNATSVEETANGAQEPMNRAAEQMDVVPTFRTYINYQIDTFYLTALHIDMPSAITPETCSCFLQDFILQALPPHDKLYRVALGYSEEEPKVDDHIKFLFQLPNLEAIYLVFFDTCCVDRNIPHIDASHFTEPSHNLLNGEFRTSAKDVHEELLASVNELIEMEEENTERPLSGDDFTTWKDARERQWRDLKVIPKMISRN